MASMKFFNYLLLTSILLFPIGSANAVRSKLLLEVLGFFEGKNLARSLTSNHTPQKHFTSSRKAFFGTTQRDNPQLEREAMTDKTMNKKLQIVDVGKKDYKFDPKTSMYYYEDKGNKELKAIKQPELKEFDTFVEFDVKKK